MGEEKEKPRLLSTLPFSIHGPGRARRHADGNVRGFHVIKRSLPFRVRNVTRGTFLGDAIEKAESSAQRRTGLLKHKKLVEGEGLWIAPCEAVHTFFMKFAIDLIYIDRKHRVKSVVRGVRPWRFSACFSAHSILELPTGTIDRTKTEKGDELELRPG